MSRRSQAKRGRIKRAELRLNFTGSFVTQLMADLASPLQQIDPLSLRTNLCIQQQAEVTVGVPNARQSRPFRNDGGGSFFRAFIGNALLGGIFKRESQ